MTGSTLNKAAGEARGTGLNPAFGLEDLRVLSVRVESGQPAEDVDTSVIIWNAAYYEPDEQMGDGSPRVVIGTLHAHADDGWGTITVGGVFSEFQETPNDESELATLIAESVALETLYDFARVTFKTVAGAADAHFDLPYKSPAAEVRKGEEELIITDRPRKGEHREIASDSPAQLES